MGTVIQPTPQRNADRPHRWPRPQRAELFDPSLDLKAQGLSLRQAAQALAVPRSTLGAWRAHHQSLDEHAAVVAFFQSAPGLAFLHRLVLAIHLVCTEVGACGIRLVCLLVTLSGLDRFIAASYGAQQHVNRQVEEAIVTSRRQEHARLAKEMPAQAITLAKDETLSGGLCLVSLEPQSNYLILEHAAQGRDPDTWNELMERALAGLHCQVIQSTSDEAPGLLADVAHPLGAHPSPDLFHVQHELVKAVCGPLATKQRAASKAASEAQARLEQAQEPLAPTGDAPHSQAPDSSPQAPLSLEQAQHEAQAARQELERISMQREQVAQNIRGSGQAYHVVDVERGVRRNGQLIVADIQRHIDTIRGVAQHEALSQRCFDRIDKAQRVVPKMQATIDFVSGYVREQVRGLDLAPSVAYALHAHLMPASSLERVAQTRTVSAGEPLRE